MSISESDLHRCLLLLEPYASHAATWAIHDPLYALLSDDSDAMRAELAMALSEHSSHPAVPEISRILAGHVSVVEPDMHAVLVKFGPVETPDDLAGEVARRLQKSASERRVLHGRIEVLEAALQVSKRSSNAVATIGAFALLFSIVGWAVALGWLEVTWLESPSRPNTEQAQSVR